MLVRHRFLIAGVLAAASLGPVLAPAADSVRAEDAEGPRAEVAVVAADTGSLLAEADRRVARMDVRDKAASVVMGHIPTTDTAALRAYMADSGLGGFILMGANIPGDEGALRAVTSALTIDAALPPLLAIDQEGGDVSRLPWDSFPAARALKDVPAADAALAFAGRAALVLRAGIGVNFGIVADVAPDASSFIYRRSLGTTPAAAAERVAAAVSGEAASVLSTLKHFPGHGAAPGDSHSGIPSTAMSEAEWRAADGEPFAAGIDAGAPLLMFGHLAYESVDAAPASLSARWHQIARDELGFEGVAITDDLGMLQASGDASYADPVANAVHALAAGNDMVLAVMFTDAGTAGRIIDGIVAAVESGELTAERLDEAARRTIALRLQLAAAGTALLPCADCAAAG